MPPKYIVKDEESAYLNRKTQHNAQKLYPMNI